MATPLPPYTSNDDAISPIFQGSSGTPDKIVDRWTLPETTTTPYSSVKVSICGGKDA
jgi:hypothetical protein